MTFVYILISRVTDPDISLSMLVESKPYCTHHIRISKETIV